ncbi:Fic family protein [Thiohalomonas denitrificans]|uniref:Protein adenylyltransferase n=1 Tax=Thiohalomonas denitrificans TaxID=415747 RepID=A0A1G5QZF2_9GAMM|nr:Fic family protein [Thiohalomonas denitrificans]SCZ67096.1 Fic family protein [Thiohalomonas denitrificans]
MERSGTYRQTLSGYKAFFPADLPPEPPVSLDGDLVLLLSEADRALGAINTIASVLPSTDLFVAMFIQKEALLSSQIEGTQSSLTDVLGADEEHIPTADVGEVVNYVKAMRYGLRRLLDDDFPMSLRLLREIHGVLMQQVRGGKPALTPGEFRTGQNWIGGANLKTARFIPPPPEAMQSALDHLEKYLYVSDDLPVLVQCALIHYQFETIHPFNDGNGRLGRLLITFFLVWRGVIEEPMLYLSAYLKTYQQEYYDRLMQVRNSGNFEAWIRFFLEGVVSVSDQVVSTTKRLQQQERNDTDRLIDINAGPDAVRLLRHLMQQPVVMVKDVQQALGITYGKANALISTFERCGILHQISQGRRNRKFSYKQYIDILAEGTEMTPGDETPQASTK